MSNLRGQLRSKRLNFELTKTKKSDLVECLVASDEANHILWEASAVFVNNAFKFFYRSELWIVVFQTT